MAKNGHLRGTYMYTSVYGVPPPPGVNKPLLWRGSKNYYVSGATCRIICAIQLISR